MFEASDHLCHRFRWSLRGKEQLDGCSPASHLLPIWREQSLLFPSCSASHFPALRHCAARPPGVPFRRHRPQLRSDEPVEEIQLVGGEPCKYLLPRLRLRFELDPLTVEEVGDPAIVGGVPVQPARGQQWALLPPWPLTPPPLLAHQ